MENDILNIYNTLLKTYGPQGWWPISNKGYHKLDYSIPNTTEERVEICIGTILTQNTSWTQAQKAIYNLKSKNLFSWEKILNYPQKELATLIKPAGYLNQKSKYLKNLASFFYSNPENINRNSILKISGVGPETADCILLYALNIPSFVVDTYTKRIFSFLNFFPYKSPYNKIQNLFTTSLPKSLEIYMEYHALIVEHAKHFYSKKTWGENDLLLRKYMI